MTSTRNQMCLCCIILVIVLFYFYFSGSSPKKTTQDTEMYAAVLITSKTCPFCIQQLDIIKTEGGSQAQERIKILDTVDNAEEIKMLVGNVSSVPLWYDPISGFQSPGLKTMAEIKNMGIILE
jgi:hypothetical protein